MCIFNMAIKFDSRWVLVSHFADAIFYMYTADWIFVCMEFSIVNPSLSSRISSCF